MSDERSTVPTLVEAVDRRIDRALRRLRVMFPGIVVDYDAATRTASIQPALMESAPGETGDDITKPLPILHDVPVAMLGSGTTRIKFPIAKGDPIMLVFANASIARWKLGGGLVDPADARHHNINDAVAWPGLTDIAHAQDDDVMIEFTATEIRAGGTEPLVTRSEFLHHTHATAGTGTPSPPICATIAARSSPTCRRACRTCRRRTASR